MKNLRLKPFIALVAFIALGFTACQKESEPAPVASIVGKWEAKTEDVKIYLSDGALSPNSYTRSYGGDYVYILEINADKTYKKTYTTTGGGEVETGTYVLDGNKLQMKSTESGYETVEEYVLNNNELTLKRSTTGTGSGRIEEITVYNRK